MLVEINVHQREYLVNLHIHKKDFGLVELFYVRQYIQLIIIQYYVFVLYNQYSHNLTQTLLILSIHHHHHHHHDNHLI